MKRITSINDLKQGTKIVHVEDNKNIKYYEFLMVHPHNENYVLLLESLSQNAYKFYIPNIIGDDSHFYIEYTEKEVLELRKKYLLNEMDLLNKEEQWINSRKTNGKATYKTSSYSEIKEDRK